VVVGAVLELLHEPNFGIGKGAVAFLLANGLQWPILVVRIDFEPVVNVDGLGLDASGSDHLDLFGFTVVQGSGVLECV
jgi:hypothetical protein